MMYCYPTIAAAFGLVTVLASGCEQSAYCADVSVNASIVDVAYHEQDGRAYVSLYHHLSYCTGTDEKRHAMELIDIDLGSATFTTMHRTANEVELFAIPENAYPLMRDGNFSNTGQCAACELVLNTRESGHTLRFVTQEDYQSAMLLHVESAGVEILTIEIGGYESLLYEGPAN